MPQPCPAVSPPHDEREAAAARGGRRERPGHRFAGLARARFEAHLVEDALPGRQTAEIDRAVKSSVMPVGRCGAMRASSKRGVVAYRTTMRAGRSVRLQMMARPSVTSPLWTPEVICGRFCREATRPGAAP